MRTGVAAAVVAAAVLGACTGPDEEPPAPITGETSPPFTGDLYLSIGDSWATGFRDAGGESGPTRDAFPQQVTDVLAARGEEVTLVNLACTGTLAAQALSQPGCDAENRAIDGHPYTGTQVEAALDVVAQHPGQVRLVTVVLGGNDLAPCLPDAADVVPPDSRDCLDRVVPEVADDLAQIATGLREALGPDVPVVGIGYPDLWLALGPTQPDVAAETLEVFRDQIDPALRAAFEDAGGSYVDLTATFDGYADPAITVPVAGEGAVPAPVAGICIATYYCSDRDTHPRPEGHRAIARDVVARS
ncbi:SGNH/GDSL hydrolase family protein [Litorihabitans aurantiacus]|uniref:SGNH hydrolase-type esterase domain-containing protein n=1 Tax=Litorihabitans aurantiacus TaxID=1930061 RepID=A0AA38CPB0_9MICO|nr:GDSL-type esterase/lipase family protein [Litorihabitans aurantiacus]GMA31838.1 hypothetical protein GCM10025875_18300 [Litorihabitans aurantiacus]